MWSAELSDRRSVVIEGMSIRSNSFNLLIDCVIYDLNDIIEMR
jgi:hypothetical protein